MKNPIQKSFAIVTVAIVVFVLGRFYLWGNFASSRLYDPFVDWATNFVTTYLLVFGYSLLVVNFVWRRIQMQSKRTQKGEQQPQESPV